MGVETSRKTAVVLKPPVTDPRHRSAALGGELTRYAMRSVMPWTIAIWQPG